MAGCIARFLYKVGVLSLDQNMFFHKLTIFIQIFMFSLACITSIVKLNVPMYYYYEGRELIHHKVGLCSWNKHNYTIDSRIDSVGSQLGSKFFQSSTIIYFIGYVNNSYFIALESSQNRDIQDPQENSIPFYCNNRNHSKQL